MAAIVKWRMKMIAVVVWRKRKVIMWRNEESVMSMKDENSGR